MTEIQIGKRYRIRYHSRSAWSTTAGGSLITPLRTMGDMAYFRDGDTHWVGLMPDVNPNEEWGICADGLELVLPGDPDAAPAGETRVTDPVTGGQKGSKEERYDLMPPKAWMEIARTVNDIDQTQPEMLLAGRASRFAWEFWSGGGTDCLALAGALALAATSKAFDDPTMVMAADEIASVYGRGAKKYELRNWERGYAWGLSFAAGMRHIMAHLGDDPVDEESGLLHLAHFVWHCLTLMTFSEHFPEKDDRSTLR